MNSAIPRLRVLVAVEKGEAVQLLQFPFVRSQGYTQATNFDFMKQADPVDRTLYIHQFDNYHAFTETTISECLNISS